MLQCLFCICKICCRRSDYFETLEECALLPGCLPVGLGPGCTARKCIIDKNSRIGANVQIVNKDGVQVRFDSSRLIWGMLTSHKDIQVPAC